MRHGILLPGKGRAFVKSWLHSFFESPYEKKLVLYFMEGSYKSFLAGDF
jgi:hypothetical protein